ncbi:hypothetical protein [Rhodococcus sp. WAY2]|uniref:hypothetical protein n=1 Tax=Rhodococcus sp. WAY2 TaxID=2663121 RepID=UPI00131F6AF6|nr:hypothetical protein [Rhodococcus sp. WAY2]QHE73224.1 hypothetical protein GFS60_06879 [Rhodococcus sp. WAY2]
MRTPPHGSTRRPHPPRGWRRIEATETSKPGPSRSRPAEHTLLTAGKKLHRRFADTEFRSMTP